jgi:hypothetical protein
MLVREWGARPPPFTIFTIFEVYALAERALNTISSLPLCTLWFEPCIGGSTTSRAIIERQIDKYVESRPSKHTRIEEDSPIV